MTLWTAAPGHRPQRPAGSTHSSTRGLRPPEQLERQAAPPNSTVSVSSQRHPEQLPEVTGTSRGIRIQKHRDGTGVGWPPLGSGKAKVMRTVLVASVADAEAVCREMKGKCRLEQVALY